MNRLFIALLLVIAGNAQAGTPSFAGLRWFQIEVSVFTNEFPEDSEAEVWTPQRTALAYLPRARPFAQFADLFRIVDFEQKVLGLEVTPVIDSLAPELVTEQDLIETIDLSSIAPLPFASTGNFKLADPARDPFLLLPASMSDFQTTNTRIDNSANNRLLFHAVWRQPMQDERNTAPLIVLGGERYNDHYELEGSIAVHFNSGADRIVINANLWLTNFTRELIDDEGWSLPDVGVRLETVATDNPTLSDLELPAVEFNIRRIVNMQQSREMRSNEFHYLDHPAMGLVVTVIPYDLPPPISLEQNEL